MRRSLVVLLAVLVVAGCSDGKTFTDESSIGDGPITSTSSTAPAPASSVRWELTGQGWAPRGGTPPACPQPLAIGVPADLSRATAVLYPGQVRGDYKPHGGIRFDGVPADQVTVRSPIDGVVVRGGRYLVGGERQYYFDLINPCGLMVRLGHLLVPTPAFQAIADRFPPPVENDSRSTMVEPPAPVKAGDVIATAVGVRAGANTFFDLGVYDLRQPNERSKDPAWAASHDKELAGHAVCWLDLLPADASARLRALPPGDPTAGRTSDFCT